MSNKLKIVYMGTPEFAVAGLKALLENGYDVVGVVTAPDKPAGRGRSMNESAVKVFAMEKGLVVLQPEKLRNSYFLEALESLGANIFVIVAFRMLPEVVWKMPAHGTFNLHASLLPQYRGAAPINWVIINGEKTSGVTTFFIDENIDTGSILLQKKVDLEKDETAGSLHDKLMILGSELILDTVQLISEGKAKPQKQDENDQLKKAPKIFREDCRIDWNRPAREIEQLIRGLSPYPGAWTIFRNDGEDTELKIYEAEVLKVVTDEAAGSILLSEKGLQIVAGDGVLKLKSVKLSGKRKMDAISLRNGIRFAGEYKML